MHVSSIALFRPLIPFSWSASPAASRFHSGWAAANSAASANPHRRAPEPIPQIDPHKHGVRFGINIALTLAVLGAALSGRVEPAVCFMLGTVLALIVNFPNVELQRKKLEDHARAAITMTAILCAAGAFTGILRGTGMLSAMAGACVRAVPAQWGHHIPLLVAILGMPLSLAFDPDSWYFGVLPVIASAAGAYGVAPIKVAQASLLGMHTTGFPVSPLTPATFLVTGLAGVDLGEHQRFTGPFLFLLSIVMTVAAVLFRVIPLMRPAMTIKTLRIGAGAGFAGDRIDPAVDLARDGRLDYLVFECLAERTIALAQLARHSGRSAGFDPMLRERMEAVLPHCAKESHPHHLQHGRGQSARRRR